VSNEVQRVTLLCDFNRDGVVNQADLAAFMAAYRDYHATGAYDKLYDVFPFAASEDRRVPLYDGRIDYQDAREVIEACRPWRW
jgi:hypothetical protein